MCYMRSLMLQGFSEVPNALSKTSCVNRTVWICLVLMALPRRSHLSPRRVDPYGLLNPLLLYTPPNVIPIIVGRSQSTTSSSWLWCSPSRRSTRIPSSYPTTPLASASMTTTTLQDGSIWTACLCSLHGCEWFLTIDVTGSINCSPLLGVSTPNLQDRSHL